MSNTNGNGKKEDAVHAPWVGALGEAAQRAASALKALEELTGLTVQTQWGAGADRSTLTVRFVNKHEVATAAVTAPAPIGKEGQLFLDQAVRALAEEAVARAREDASRALANSRQTAAVIVNGEEARL